jgi:alpha-beta hydrolase superfamily lysophospholipase
MDHENHGKSTALNENGLMVYIYDFDKMVDDAAEYFKSIQQEFASTGLKHFLWGESMGGAMVLMLHLQNKLKLDGGAILVAPMCQISPSMMPHPAVVWGLRSLVSLGPFCFVA